MNDELILRKIQKVLSEFPLTKYNYLNLANYFNRLYIEQSVQDNIVKYMDNNPKGYVDKIDFIG